MVSLNFSIVGAHLCNKPLQYHYSRVLTKLTLHLRTYKQSTVQLEKIWADWIIVEWIRLVQRTNTTFLFILYSSFCSGVLELSMKVPVWTLLQELRSEILCKRKDNFSNAIISLRGSPSVVWDALILLLSNSFYDSVYVSLYTEEHTLQEDFTALFSNIFVQVPSSTFHLYKEKQKKLSLALIRKLQKCFLFPVQNWEYYLVKTTV